MTAGARGLPGAGAILCAAAWIVFVARTRPSPFETGWAVALLLLAPLVLVPLGLRLVEPPDGRAAWAFRAAVVLQAPAALALVGAFALPAGPAAGALAVPWLAVTGLAAVAGLARLWRRRRRRDDGGIEDVALDLGLVYLAVGGAWTVLSRLGARPLGFEDVIVLLTAIHFHHAGFVLPLLTARAGRALGGALPRVAAAGVVGGVPLLAAGITARQVGLSPAVEVAAASLLSLAGLLTAFLHLRLAARPGRPPAVRALFAIAGLALALALVLAALYGARAYGGPPGLDIPWMRALHGTANALGFGLGGLLGWSIRSR